MKKITLAVSLAAICLQLCACTGTVGRPKVISQFGVNEKVTKHATEYTQSLFSRFSTAANVAYPSSVSAAADPVTQRRFLRTGFDLIAAGCNSYFVAKSNRQRSVNVLRDSFAPITALATGLIGIADNGDTISNEFLTVLGLASSAANAGFEIYEERYLFGAENVGSVRTLIRNALSVDASAKLRRTNANLSYTQSVIDLMDNQLVCSPGKIKELVRDAIEKGNVVPIKTSGGPADAGTGTDTGSGTGTDAGTGTDDNHSDDGEQTASRIEVRIGDR
ncbi:MAG: hypothetical protein V3V15_09175 [Sphingorhabdus sp.]